MAKANISIAKLKLFIFIVIVILFSSAFTHTNSQEFSRKLSKNEMGLKREKLSHLRFYLHDIVSGPNPTAVRVAEAPMTNSSLTRFGMVVMIDDPLTLGPELGSKIVGRAQGMYASSDLKDFGLFMALNYVFTEGNFNGSTLSILGRNVVLWPKRELPIVGGTGVFRFAHGYAEARTHTLSLETGDAVVEYNVYVFHY